MRKGLVLLAILLVTGCATVQYTTPNGITVNYTRVLSTTDKIEATLPGGTKVVVTGQNYNIDLVAVAIEAAGGVITKALVPVAK